MPDDVEIAQDILMGKCPECKGIDVHLPGCKIAFKKQYNEYLRNLGKTKIDPDYYKRIMEVLTNMDTK